MRVADEPNVELLRKKAAVLEAENERLVRDYAAALRQVLALKGMSPEAIELNLPGLLERATKPTASAPSSSEKRKRKGKNKGNTEEPQKGHGPTEQPKLEVQQQTFDLDEPDKVCRECGGELQEWEGAEDEVEVVDVVERKWVLKKCKLKKYRCRCGGCVETAEGPDKLIKGGRYTTEVAIATATGKHVDHLPLERQAKMARRQGLKVTTQTLWDQLWALAVALEPVCERLKEHILRQPVIGADLTGFKLIEKGGSKKQQVWQLSCPEAIYFDIKPSKHAEVGADLFRITDKADKELVRFGGVAVVDGAPELLAIANGLGFETAGCWSHARRNVLKADGEAPGQVAEFLEMVGELYAIDKKAARDPPENADDRRRGYRHLIDLDELARLRDTESREVCNRIEAWILAQSCIPGGLLKGGLEYVADRWTRLKRFLDDPRIPLDNNLTEGCFVGLAIGRRNYVGARSQRGLIAASRFYSVVESTHVCGGDGDAYLRYAVQTITRGGTPLLPHEWVPAD